MRHRKIIINSGLARCGTTATDKLMRDLPEILPPNDIKELKFFLKKPKSPEAYFQHFAPDPGKILFESSPPYMHNGVDSFRTVLSRIRDLARDSGAEVTHLFHVRNLLKRAFSHYWHDINGHYAIYGKYWSVRTPDDPQRYKALYRQSFEDAVTLAAQDDKFLPQLGEMLHIAIDMFGQDMVRIVHTSDLNAGISDFLEQVTGRSVKIEVPRIPGTQAPAYFHGGHAGQAFTFPAENDTTEDIEIPADSCLMFARRHGEYLSGSDYDLDALKEAESCWSHRVDTATLPQRVFDYLAAQRDALAALPEACFLSGGRGGLLADLAEVPAQLSIKAALPAASGIKRVLWGK